MQQGVVQLVNPKSPRAGIHLATETFFSAAGVMVIAYQRNTFDNTDTPNGIKTCLKIVMVPRRGPNDYGAFTETGTRISVEVELAHTQKLAAVLYGVRDRYNFEIIRRGKPKKTFALRRQQSESQPFVLEVSDGARTLVTPLSGADGWQALMVLLRVLQELQPGVEDKVLLDTFVRMA